MRSELSAEYRRHLGSVHWKSVRQCALDRAGNRCQQCGAADGLQVHHLHYDTLGHETLEDLLVVCGPCHVVVDEERRAEVRLRNARRLYDARVNGWATTVYGEGWRGRISRTTVEEEFDDWVRRRGG